MKKEYKYNKSMDFILTKMCKSVGCDFATFDFKKENWYWKYEWTEKQETEFKNWLADYLYKNPKARKEIMAFASFYKTKAKCTEWAMRFTSWYGWKTKKK